MPLVISKIKIFLTLALCIICMFNASAQEAVQVVVGPQEPPYQPERPIAIVGGTLIDGTGAAPVSDRIILISGRTITAVGTRNRIAVPEGAEIIDASGMTVMPGLIDSNQHLHLDPLLPASTADLPLDALKARWERNFAGI